MAPLDAATLAGSYSDKQSVYRRKAWKALGAWISFRLSRQRGVHIPNLLQICWKTDAASSGTRVRRPVFLLSDRFTDNFGVRQGGVVERGLPAPASGDDVNFYQLAIQHSDGLTKDQAFTYTRDMLFRLGQAAGQGAEMRLDLGAGTLVVNEREATFEFGGTFGGGGGGGGEQAGGGSKHDPLLGGGGGVDLAMCGRKAGGGGGSSCLSLGSSCRAPGRGGRGGRRSAGSLSLEEESELFAAVDELDPETRAAGSESGTSTLLGDALESKTRSQVGHALGIADDALGGETIEQLGAALGAKAAALEDQLRRQRLESDRIEAKLKARGVDVSTRKPSASSAGGSGVPPGRARVAGKAASAAVPRPPPLAVGFGGAGDASLTAPLRHPTPSEEALGASRSVHEIGRQRVPTLVMAPSDTASLPSRAGHRAPGTGMVPTAPPLPPFRYSYPQPNDAAAVAWKALHAAPAAGGRPSRIGGATGRPPQKGRSVGGPAPPFLAAPPVVAAAAAAKGGGKAWAG